MAALQASPREPFSAETLAARIGSPEKAELVFKILEHLAANKTTGVKKRAKAVNTESTYRLS